uniref:Uncharacterized protein n=1 Tax=Anguilla anguilla TaxID=7936 RepID=A0A0E9R0E8_ANGAN
MTPGGGELKNSRLTFSHCYWIDCVPVSNFLFSWTNQQTLPVRLS